MIEVLTLTLVSHAVVMRIYIHYNSQYFNKLLHNFNLSQHVFFPTQDSGYNLELIITYDSSKLNIHSFYIDTCISDHKSICVDHNLLKLHI